MMRMKLKVWLVFDAGTKFGHGRAELLQFIDRLGSIQQAANQLGMSYRNAWGYLRELEKATGVKLLQRPAGRGPAAGTRLTPEARLFLERYRRFEAELGRAARTCFPRVFPSPRKKQQP